MSSPGPLKKYLSAALCGALFVTNCALAHAIPMSHFGQKVSARHLAENRHPGEGRDPGLKPFLKSAGVLDSGLRRNDGAGHDEPVIIHIQDVHKNLEAQQNIAAYVKELIEKGEVDLIALEGAFGPINLSTFQTFPHQDIIQKVADYLLREHRISGPIHSLLSTLNSLPVVGVDDEALYEANVEAYRGSSNFQFSIFNQLSVFKDQLDSEKKKVFGKELLAFDEKVNAYRDETLSMGDYVRALAVKKTSFLTHVELFIEALGLEDSLDFGRVEAERGHVLTLLLSRLDGAQTSELIRISTAYKMGDVDHTAFYGYLKKMCERHNVSLRRFKAMNDYLQYVLLSDQIDGEKLPQEIRSLEKEIYAALAETESERALIEKDRELYLTEKLVNFSLTPAEWKEYKSSPFDVGSFEEFYRVAEKRDSAIAQKLLGAMEKHKAKTAVLVTGGFHSKGIEKAVGRGSSVVRFTPKITQLNTSEGSKYLSVFSQKATPLEELFKGQKLFLADNPVAGTQIAPALAAGLMPSRAGWVYKWLAPLSNAVVRATQKGTNEVLIFIQTVKKSLTVQILTDEAGIKHVQATTGILSATTSWLLMGFALFKNEPGLFIIALGLFLVSLALLTTVFSVVPVVEALPHGTFNDVFSVASTALIGDTQSDPPRVVSINLKEVLTEAIRTIQLSQTLSRALPNLDQRFVGLDNINPQLEIEIPDREAEFQIGEQVYPLNSRQILRRNIFELLKNALVEPAGGDVRLGITLEGSHNDRTVVLSINNQNEINRDELIAQLEHGVEQGLLYYLADHNNFFLRNLGVMRLEDEFEKFGGAASMEVVTRDRFEDLLTRIGGEDQLPFVYGVGRDKTGEATGGRKLGLSEAKRWATAMGGSLRLQSSPENGTTVSLLLPLSQKVPPLHRPASRPSSSERRYVRYLPLMKDMEAMLETLGYSLVYSEIGDPVAGFLMSYRDRGEDATLDYLGKKVNGERILKKEWKKVMAQGAAVPLRRLEIRAAQVGMSLEEFLSFLGVPRTSKGLVVIGRHVEERQRTLLEETTHALENTLYYNPFFNWVEAVEIVNDFVQLMFYPYDRLNEFKSPYTNWSLNEKRDLYKRYILDKKLNPNTQIRKILLALRRDIKKGEVFNVLFRRVIDNPAPLFQAGFFQGRVHEDVQEGAIDYLDVLLKNEKFSDFSPLYPGWKLRPPTSPMFLAPLAFNWEAGWLLWVSLPVAFLIFAAYRWGPLLFRKTVPADEPESESEPAPGLVTVNFKEALDGAINLIRKKFPDIESRLIGLNEIDDQMSVEVPYLEAEFEHNGETHNLSSRGVLERHLAEILKNALVEPMKEEVRVEIIVKERDHRNYLVFRVHNENEINFDGLKEQLTQGMEEGRLYFVSQHENFFLRDPNDEELERIFAKFGGVDSLEVVNKDTFPALLEILGGDSQIPFIYGIGRDKTTDVTGGGRLGLSEAQRWTSFMGGTIVLQSPSDKGTTVSLVLPMASNQLSDDPSSSAGSWFDNPDYEQNWAAPVELVAPLAFISLVVSKVSHVDPFVLAGFAGLLMYAIFRWGHVVFRGFAYADKPEVKQLALYHAVVATLIFLPFIPLSLKLIVAAVLIFHHTNVNNPSGLPHPVLITGDGPLSLLQEDKQDDLSQVYTSIDGVTLSYFNEQKFSEGTFVTLSLKEFLLEAVDQAKAFFRRNIREAGQHLIRAEIDKELRALDKTLDSFVSDADQKVHTLAVIEQRMDIFYEKATEFLANEEGFPNPKIVDEMIQAEWDKLPPGISEETVKSTVGEPARRVEEKFYSWVDRVRSVGNVDLGDYIEGIDDVPDDVLVEIRESKYDPGVGKKHTFNAIYEIIKNALIEPFLGTVRIEYKPEGIKGVPFETIYIKNERPVDLAQLRQKLKEGIQEKRLYWMPDRLHFFLRNSDRQHLEGIFQDFNKNKNFELISSYEEFEERLEEIGGVHEIPFIFGLGRDKTVDYFWHRSIGFGASRIGIAYMGGALEFESNSTDGTTVALSFKRHIPSPDDERDIRRATTGQDIVPVYVGKAVKRALVDLGNEPMDPPIPDLLENVHVDIDGEARVKLKELRAAENLSPARNLVAVVQKALRNAVVEPTGGKVQIRLREEGERFILDIKNESSIDLEQLEDKVREAMKAGRLYYVPSSKEFFVRRSRLEHLERFYKRNQKQLIPITEDNFEDRLKNTAMRGKMEFPFIIGLGRDKSGEPFSGGTTGLSDIRAAVKRLGGTLDLTSSPEEGTTLSLAFEKDSPKKVLPRQPVLPKSIDLKKKFDELLQIPASNGGYVFVLYEPFLHKTRGMTPLFNKAKPHDLFFVVGEITEEFEKSLLRYNQLTKGQIAQLKAHRSLSPEFFEALRDSGVERLVFGGVSSSIEQNGLGKARLTGPLVKIMDGIKERSDSIRFWVHAPSVVLESGEHPPYLPNKAKEIVRRDISADAILIPLEKPKVIETPVVTTKPQTTEKKSSWTNHPLFWVGVGVVSMVGVFALLYTIGWISFGVVLFGVVAAGQHSFFGAGDQEPLSPYESHGDTLTISVHFIFSVALDRLEEKGVDIDRVKGLDEISPELKITEQLPTEIHPELVGRLISHVQNGLVKALGASADGLVQIAVEVAEEKVRIKIFNDGEVDEGDLVQAALNYTRARNLLHVPELNMFLVIGETRVEELKKFGISEYELVEDESHFWDLYRSVGPEQLSFSMGLQLKNSFLIFKKAEPSQSKEPMSVNLSDFLKAALKSVDSPRVHMKAGLEPRPIYLKGSSQPIDLLQMQVGLAEIIQNALGHPEDGTVDVDVQEGDGTVSVLVKNDAPIDFEKLKEKLFEAARNGILFREKLIGKLIVAERSVSSDLLREGVGQGFDFSLVSEEDLLELDDDFFEIEILYVSGLSLSEQRGKFGGEGMGTGFIRDGFRFVGAHFKIESNDAIGTVATVTFKSARENFDGPPPFESEGDNNASLKSLLKKVLSGIEAGHPSYSGRVVGLDEIDPSLRISTYKNGDSHDNNVGVLNLGLDEIFSNALDDARDENVTVKVDVIQNKVHLQIHNKGEIDTEALVRQALQEVQNHNLFYLPQEKLFSVVGGFDQYLDELGVTERESVEDTDHFWELLREVTEDRLLYSLGLGREKGDHERGGVRTGLFDAYFGFKEMGVEMTITSKAGEGTTATLIFDKGQGNAPNSIFHALARTHWFGSWVYRHAGVVGVLGLFAEIPLLLYLKLQSSNFILPFGQIEGIPAYVLAVLVFALFIELVALLHVFLYNQDPNQYKSPNVMQDKKLLFHFLFLLPYAFIQTFLDPIMILAIVIHVGSDIYLFLKPSDHDLRTYYSNFENKEGKLNNFVNDWGNDSTALDVRTLADLYPDGQVPIAVSRLEREVELLAEELEKLNTRNYFHLPIKEKLQFAIGFVQVWNASLIRQREIFNNDKLNSLLKAADNHDEGMRLIVRIQETIEKKQAATERFLNNRPLGIRLFIRGDVPKVKEEVGDIRLAQVPFILLPAFINGPVVSFDLLQWVLLGSVFIGVYMVIVSGIERLKVAVPVFSKRDLRQISVFVFLPVLSFVFASHNALPDAMGFIGALFVFIVFLIPFVSEQGYLREMTDQVRQFAALFILSLLVWGVQPYVTSLDTVFSLILLPYVAFYIGEHNLMDQDKKQQQEQEKRERLSVFPPDDDSQAYKRLAVQLNDILPLPRMEYGKRFREAARLVAENNLPVREAVGRSNLLPLHNNDLLLVHESQAKNLKPVLKGINSLLHKNGVVVVIAQTTALANALRADIRDSRVYVLVDQGAFNEAFVDLNILESQVERHFPPGTALNVFMSNGISEVRFDKDLNPNSAFANPATLYLDLVLLLSVFETVKELSVELKLKAERAVKLAA